MLGLQYKTLRGCQAIFHILKHTGIQSPSQTKNFLVSWVTEAQPLLKVDAELAGLRGYTDTTTCAGEVLENIFLSFKKKENGHDLTFRK